MKFTLLSTTLFLASLFAQATALINIDPFPSHVRIGQSYELTWNATAKYTYAIWLVIQNPVPQSSTYIRLWTVADSLTFDSLEGHYDWTVPSNVATSGNHSLLLTALTVPFDGRYYSNYTNWFQVSLPSTPTSSGEPTHSATASATATASSVPGETSSSAPSSEHHSGISGGAIAGVVIGSLLGLAFVIGGFLFFVWRRKRSAKQEREAAARASRLAPVMEQDPPSYEMQRTPPQQFPKSSGV